MASRFGWIDFAEDDRQQMLEVVRMFHEQDTRDELGIGVIRDAFSDFFFPGTSTIQTRAKYMLFIPWIYLELERKDIEYPEIVERARKSEIKLINALCNSKDQDGIIGKDAREELQRLPSVIYWSGLSSWGIRAFEGSQEQYHRYFNHFSQQERQFRREEDEENIRLEEWKSWHKGIPAVPDDFLEKSSLGLSKEQAYYLQERILTTHADSLLAILVNQNEIIDSDFVWNNPILKKLSGSLLQEINHARNFSETIYGAALLYNLMLSEARENKEWVKSYSERIKDWSKAIESRWADISLWLKQNNFWSAKALNTIEVISSRSFNPAKVFVESWWSLVFKAGKVDDLVKHKEVRKLIQDREIDLKRGRARLDNQRALEAWMGAAGDSQLDFRWNISKKIAKDIVTGING